MPSLSNAAGTSNALGPGAALAAQIFATLAELGADPPGITRAAFSLQEQQAHDLVAQAAMRLGAKRRVDAFGNSYLTLAGVARNRPAIVVGSHVDSVPHGGNYDGLAGVLAGLGVIAELSKAGLVPPRDLTLALFRAEEAAWFPLSYPGSRAALGRLAPAELRSARSDTGRSLADHLVDAGFDPDPIRRGIPQIHPKDIAAFIEVHIEQGPRLLTLGCPLGIVTSIAGGFRFTEAHCRGQYAHSGAEPRFSRRDAVLGFADLMVALEAEWDTIETSGREATITVGRVQSDPAEHGGSKVLGDVGFTLDLRSADESLLADLRLRIIAICRDIEARRGVRFDLGPSFSWSAAEMSAALRGRLSELAAEMGPEAPPVPSGAGHDAVTFAEAGIPTAMVFLRNRNGSHNPDEDMDVADLDAAIRLLTRFVMSFDE